MDSILTSVKKMLGIEETYTHFDSDIVMHINTVFMTLNQLGLGPEEGFTITDKTAVWGDLIIADKNLEMIKSLTYMKVRLLFDPPQTSFVIDAVERQIKELEWRLNVYTDKEVTE